ncbi:MAG: SGNH/GDSL hydrolase family protein [Candidatus Didemnitutus sp.]|nr:SGNH/GDSL hydrolase family protein [Candidatus Didemnitutus sp.]
MLLSGAGRLRQAARSAGVALATILLAAPLALAAAAPQTDPLGAELAAGRPQTLVCYGTSLTAAREGWVAQSHALLKQRHGDLITIVNAAKGGENSTWGLAQLEGRVLVHRPDVVTIEFAMNDAARKSALTVAGARRNLETLIARLRAANPATRIILLTMNPLGAAVLARPAEHPFSRAELDAHYAMVREVAAEQGLVLVDHHAAWLRLRAESPELFDRHVPDGVHPDPEISRRLILPAMLRAFGVAPVEPE